MNYLMLGLLCFFLIACNTGSDPIVNTSTDTITNQKEQDNTILADIEAKLTEIDMINAEIEAGHSHFYSVLDGWAMMAESTTYFEDEAKSKPCKTKIIYLDGSFINVYWLANEFMCLEIHDMLHLYQEGVLIQSIQDNVLIELSEQDRLEAVKLAATPIEIKTKLMQ